MTREFYVVSMSGGKDSTALAIWMREQELPHVRIFADTGWESQITYGYLDYLESVLGPIVRLQPKESFTERLLRLKTWPLRSRRWCTRELKTDPIARFVADYTMPDGYNDLVTVVGVRADESAARAKYREREWSDLTDSWVWRPLLRWSLADVLTMHAKHRMKVNPLYQLGFERVGCFPCIFAGKTELRLLAERFPERIAIIRELEQAVEVPEHHNMMFSLRAPGDPTHRPTPIDRVVEWAKTAKGGTQATLFSAPSGCARWGLCEATPDQEQERTNR